MGHLGKAFFLMSGFLFSAPMFVAACPKIAKQSGASHTIGDAPAFTVGCGPQFNEL
jgi:hypothetical protein